MKRYSATDILDMVVAMLYSAILGPNCVHARPTTIFWWSKALPRHRTPLSPAHVQSGKKLTHPAVRLQVVCSDYLHGL